MFAGFCFSNVRICSFFLFYHVINSLILDFKPLIEQNKHVRGIIHSCMTFCRLILIWKNISTSIRMKVIISSPKANSWRPIGDIHSIQQWDISSDAVAGLVEFTVPVYTLLCVHGSQTTNNSCGRGDGIISSKSICKARRSAPPLAAFGSYSGCDWPVSAAAHAGTPGCFHGKCVLCVLTSWDLLFFTQVRNRVFCFCFLFPWLRNSLSRVVLVSFRQRHSSCFICPQSLC